MEARKNKKVVTVIGSGGIGDGDANILEAVPSAPRDFWDISVSRLKDTTTDDQIRRQLHQHGIEVKDIFLIPSKIKGTKAARVRVFREHRNRVKEAKVWPVGCRVADWIQKPRTMRAEKTASYGSGAARS